MSIVTIMTALTLASLVAGQVAGWRNSRDQDQIMLFNPGGGVLEYAGATAVSSPRSLQRKFDQGSIQLVLAKSVIRGEGGLTGSAKTAVLFHPKDRWAADEMQENNNPDDSFFDSFEALPFPTRFFTSGTAAANAAHFIAEHYPGLAELGGRPADSKRRRLRNRAPGGNAPGPATATRQN